MIAYATGDATVPLSRPYIIAHVTNDQGAWGAGFVVALSRRWPRAEAAYRSRRAILGDAQLVAVGPSVWVANLCAQRGLPTRERPLALDYDALSLALRDLADHAAGVPVQMPRIGCGIAGGAWERVERIVEAELCARGIAVTVIDLEDAP